MLAVSPSAFAYVWVWVPDASAIQYSLSPDGKVYFRNLSQFNAGAQGCCWHYWIDTNTTHGKNVYALFLAKAAQGKGLYMGVPDNLADGTIDYAGEW
jgi:hypothetical protein